MSKASTIDERIARLQEQLAQAKAQKKAIEEKRAALQKKRDRALDTRKKIIIGAAILSAVEKGSVKKEGLMRLLDSFITKDSDRKLVGLEPKK